MRSLIATILFISCLTDDLSAQTPRAPTNVPAQALSASQTQAPAAESVAAQQPTVPFLDLNSEDVSVSSDSDAGVDTDLLINFGLWLIVILCLCGLTAVGLRMLNRRGVVNVGVPSGSRVVESLSLGKHRFVQLVEIGGHSVLVASDSGGIQSVVPLAEDFSETLLDATGSISEPGS